MNILDKSHKGFTWILKYNSVTSLEEVFDARIIGNKNYFLKKSVRDYWPKENDILDLKKGIDIIAHAIKNNIKIGIVGDYDVDGSSATGLLVSYFSKINANFEYHIPNRFSEGYGVSAKIIKKLIDNGVEIVITVDNGTTAYEAINFIKKSKKKIIIIDHHHLQDHIEVDAFINPHRNKSGYEIMCAAGLVFIFLVELNKFLNETKIISQEINIFNFIDVAAVATICDVMPLININRAIVATGIKKINLKPIPGYRHILKENIGNIDVQTIGYSLGPCINAPGRLGSANKAVELVTETDEVKAKAIATELVKMNFDRKEIEKDVLKKAEEQVFSQDFSNKSAIVVCGNWFEGVIGIIAGRIKDRYHKPVCVLAKNDNIWKGSLRSVHGFHIGNAVKEAISREIALMGGGHEMAGGISLKHENLEKFIDFFEETARNSNIKPILEIYIDAIVSLQSIGEILIFLEKYGPFGQSNPEPIFMFPNCMISFKKPTKNSYFLTVSSPNFQNTTDVWVFPIDEKIMDTLNKASKIHVIGYIMHDKVTKKVKIKMTDFCCID